MLEVACILVITTDTQRQTVRTHCRTEIVVMCWKNGKAACILVITTVTCIQLVFRTRQSLAFYMLLAYGFLDAFVLHGQLHVLQHKAG